jgi:hypothetical protein
MPTAVEEAIYNRATTFAGISALIGTRAYPLQLPQQPTLPALTYTRISNERVSAMGADATVARARIQLSAWGATFTSAKTLAKQILSGFQRFKGTFAGIVIHDCFILNEIDLYDSDALIYQVITDIDVIYTEP